MKWIPKYQSGNKTKYASAAKDANTGESYDIYLQDGNTYDSQGNPVSVIRTPDTIITLILIINSQLLRVMGLKKRDQKLYILNLI